MAYQKAYNLLKPFFLKLVGPGDLSSQLEDVVCWIWVNSGLASVPSSGQRPKLHRAVFGSRDLSSQLEDLACRIGSSVDHQASPPHLNETNCNEQFLVRGTYRASLRIWSAESGSSAAQQASPPQVNETICTEQYLLEVDETSCFRQLLFIGRQDQFPPALSSFNAIMRQNNASLSLAEAGQKYASDLIQ